MLRPEGAAKPPMVLCGRLVRQAVVRHALAGSPVVDEQRNGHASCDAGQVGQGQGGRFKLGKVGDDEHIGRTRGAREWFRECSVALLADYGELCHSAVEIPGDWSPRLAETLPLHG